MNRTEFLGRLEELLSDIEPEEREEALAFYTDYFEDAGKEKEDDVISKLISPERVAASIKKDLAQNGASGEFTEKGFKEAASSENAYQVIKPNEVGSHNTEEYVDVEFRDVKEEETKKEQGKYDSQNSGFAQGQGSNTANAGNENFKSSEEDLGYRIGPDGRKYYENIGRNPNRYRRQDERREGERRYEQPVYKKRSAGEVILLVLFIVFIGIPIGIPCLAVVFSLFVAAGATAFGLLVGFGAAGIGCVIAGFAVAVVGLGKLFVLPGVGALFVGGGLICLGLGLLFMVLTGLCAKAIPALCRGFVAVCRTPFRRRSVMA